MKALVLDQLFLLENHTPTRGPTSGMFILSKSTALIIPLRHNADMMIGRRIADPEAVIWILPALIAPLAASTNNVLVATLRPPDSDSLSLVGAVMMAATIVMLPVALVTGGLQPFWTSGVIAGGVIWAAAVQVVGYYALYEVIRRAGPVFFSQASYIIVLSGLAWALLLFGERPSPWVWGAVVVMVIGLVLANLANRSAGADTANTE